MLFWWCVAVVFVCTDLASWSSCLVWYSSVEQCLACIQWLRSSGNPFYPLPPHHHHHPPLFIFSVCVCVYRFCHIFCLYFLPLSTGLFVWPFLWVLIDLTLVVLVWFEQELVWCTDGIGTSWLVDIPWIWTCHMLFAILLTPFVHWSECVVYFPWVFIFFRVRFCASNTFYGCSFSSVSHFVQSVFCFDICACTHAHTHARTHARMHARTHARTHTHTHTLTNCQTVDGVFLNLQVFRDYHGSIHIQCSVSGIAESSSGNENLFFCPVLEEKAFSSKIWLWYVYRHSIQHPVSDSCMPPSEGI